MPKVQTFITKNKLPGMADRLPQEITLSLDELQDQIVLYAKAFAPVDTGYMRDHIEKTKSGVVSRAPYSSYVEYGTYKMRAQPFMRPALSAAAPGLPRYFSGLGVRLTA